MILGDLLVAAYLVVLGGIASWSLHRLGLLASVSWGQGSGRTSPVVGSAGAAPAVLVQLPMYNERAVAARVIDAATVLDWPADRLHVQVLDDSTDDTRAVVDAAVARARARGVRVSVVRRADRSGYKAGALAVGLQRTDEPLVAVFDADFVPPADFLRRTVPHLGEGVAFVQARWGHLGTDRLVTAAQAVLLDGHFLVEQGGRHARGHWFNFNGTAGVWRRRAIHEAGGWSGDTVTEDLDLSYRAQLAGWRAVYLDDVVAPAEVPPTMAAFKSQQHRWGKGAAQTAVKLLGRVWRHPGVSLGTRVDATLHLTSSFGHVLGLALALLLPWMPLARAHAGLDWCDGLQAAVGAVAFVPFVAVYGVVILRRGTSVRARLLGLPATLALGTGLGLAQTLAVFEGLTRPAGEFVRTPKQGDGAGLAYRVARSRVWVMELLLAVYLAVGLAGAWWSGELYAVPFLALFTAGYAWVGLAGAWPSGPRRATQPAARAAGPQVTSPSQAGSDHAPDAGSTVASTR